MDLNSVSAKVVSSVSTAAIWAAPGVAVNMALIAAISLFDFGLGCFLKAFPLASPPPKSANTGWLFFSPLRLPPAASMRDVM